MDMNTINYLNTLPDDITEINISNRNLNELPDLSRFKNLSYLDCSSNNLKELKLPKQLLDKLIYLICDFNNMTYIQKLPYNIIFLQCSNNLLEILPDLPNSIKHLYCYNNKLNNIDILPSSLVHLDIRNNYLNSLPMPLPKDMVSLYYDHNKILTNYTAYSPLNYIKYFKDRPTNKRKYNEL